MNKTYTIRTFGCQMNENDSEKLAGMLDEMGYVPAENEAESSIIIVNTCSVRENADQRAFGNIGQLKTYKRKNKDMVLAMCGCMMQQPEIVAQVQKKHPQVDIIFGTHNLDRFPQLLARHLADGSRVTDIDADSDPVIENVPTHRKYPFKSFVTIMQGCDNYCSYCIVPYTRGHERSRQPEHILSEVKTLVQDGCLEVTLLGQNVNSYGNDLGEDITFAGLLRTLNTVPGLERIRFMTSNPKDFTDDIITAMRECEHVMPSVHMAVQSGSTRIIKRMNRHYTKEEAIALVQKIRAGVPDIAITTDIIVGFPGETEEDFQETLDLVRRCRFDAAFSFIYSRRTGTPAADMPDQVADALKHDRISRLLDVLRECAADINAPYEGRVIPVLAEERSKRDEKRLAGRSPANKLVNFEADATLIGQIVPVKITKAGPYSLTGELV